MRFFDTPMLELYRWVGRRYVSPLAAVIGRALPPRVVSEELETVVAARSGDSSSSEGPGPLATYRNGPEFLGGIDAARDAFLVRPAPDQEVAATLEAVDRSLSTGRRALVVVPEAVPIPAAASALVAAFRDRVGSFVGGSKRARYRMWLDIQAGRYDVVVGTRPAVFAPVPDLGLLIVTRESHPALREDRAPYYHVRDVAMARAVIDRATCVLSAICPSSEAAALGLVTVAPPGRRWPPVEVVKPGPEGRAQRLVRALRDTRRGFLLSPLPGYGIAATCRACGEPARCAACGGLLRAQEGAVRCVVCEAVGRCGSCGGARFGIRRGGAERVQEWAAKAANVPVHRLTDAEPPRLPGDEEIVVGGPDDVRDLGSPDLDLVAILDADMAERRPGLAARERALTTWMEAAAWAFPNGRVIVQASRAGDPAIQALVRGNPDRFHADEHLRRSDAGFPVGAAVFRVAGTAELPDALQRLGPLTLLRSELPEQTVCLLALDPERVTAFGEAVRELAQREIVTRVEAEPHL